jgi:ABC-type transport system substrate-binding protein
MPFVRTLCAAEAGIPKGKIVLAWQTNIATRWPQQYEGAATPYNFTMALQDSLIKNFRQQRYDHLAFAEHYEFAEDAKSATFWLRPRIRFYDRTPDTPEDVKWSSEHYRGVRAEVLHAKTEGVEIVDARAGRFQFKNPFLDFPILLGTPGQAGWVVPARYYEKVGQDGFMQKPIGPGPIGSCRSSRGSSSSPKPLRTITLLCTSRISRC